MNKDQILLEEAYRIVLENEEQPFELTDKEEQMFKELSDKAFELHQQYKQMIIETIRAQKRDPQQISYPHDKHKSVIVYLRAKLLNNFQHIIDKYFPDMQMLNVMYTVCTKPFNRQSFYVDENDDLELSLHTLESDMNMTQPEVFNEDKLVKRLPKMMTDWLEYQLDQHSVYLSDYIEERKVELRNKRIDKRVSSELKDLDIEVLKDF